MATKKLKKLELGPVGKPDYTPKAMLEVIELIHRRFKPSHIVKIRGAVAPGGWDGFQIEPKPLTDWDRFKRGYWAGSDWEPYDAKKSRSVVDPKDPSWILNTAVPAPIHVTDVSQPVIQPVIQSVTDVSQPVTDVSQSAQLNGQH